MRAEIGGFKKMFLPLDFFRLSNQTVQPMLDRVPCLERYPEVKSIWHQETSAFRRVSTQAGVFKRKDVRSIQEPGASSWAILEARQVEKL